jgi:hypothetical protein
MNGQFRIDENQFVQTLQHIKMLETNHYNPEGKPTRQLQSCIVSYFKLHSCNYLKVR